MQPYSDPFLLVECFCYDQKNVLDLFRLEVYFQTNMKTASKINEVTRLKQELTALRGAKKQEDKNLRAQKKEFLVKVKKMMEQEFSLMNPAD